MTMSRRRLLERLEAVTEQLVEAGRLAINGAPIGPVQGNMYLAVANEAKRLVARAHAERDMYGTGEWDTPSPVR